MTGNALRRLRFAVLLAAIAANAVHIHLDAISSAHGWGAYLDSFAREIKYTKFLPATLALDAFFLVVWYGGPFYLMGIAAFASRSPAIASAALLSIAALAGLDVAGFYHERGRAGYALFAPIVLGAVALAGFLVLIVAAAVARRLRAKPEAACT